MRHNKTGRSLGRNWEHRKAMFRNMARSLLTHGRIRTTEPKAKELRKVTDRLVTLALRNDLHARRLAYQVLGSHQLVKKLFDEIGPLFVGVPGGFTRVVKLGMPRRGDAANLAVVEFSRQPGDEKADAKAKKGKKAATKKVEAPAPAESKKKAKAEEAPAAEAAPVQETPAEEPEALVEEAPAAEPVAEETPAEEPEEDKK